MKHRAVCFLFGQLHGTFSSVLAQFDIKFLPIFVIFQCSFFSGKFCTTFPFQCSFCRAMLCITQRMLSSCVSVCLSVTFVYFVKMSNCILKLFPPPGRHIILVFHTQQYSDRNSPNEGVKCRGCEEIATFDQYLTLSRK